MLFVYLEFRGERKWIKQPYNLESPPTNRAMVHLEFFYKYFFTFSKLCFVHLQSLFQIICHHDLSWYMQNLWWYLVLNDCRPIGFSELWPLEIGAGQSKGGGGLKPHLSNGCVDVQGGTVCTSPVLLLAVASGLSSVTALRKAMQTQWGLLLYGNTSLFAL